ncbi:MAG TPA: hypothetical protein VF984_02875 [Actinomycetota bacterium]
MHVFAIAVLLGLAVTIVAGFAERYLIRIPEFRALVLVGLGVGAAWATGFNVWSLWGISSRAGWLGTTLTGVMLGGIGYAWHVTLGLFSGLVRKVTDEATTMERTQGLRAA